MNNAAEYNAQARINPVYLTAKTAVCLMAQAGIPDAEAVVRALGLENNEPLQAMPDADTILGNALVVEAKYRTMCRLIEKSGYQTCVDLPCGYTPKALHMTEQGRQFIGMDLPIVVQEMAPIMQGLAQKPERMAFYGVDATNLTSLETALQGVEGPLCITTEGMLMYFTDDEVIAVIANIRALLEKNGGCWITPDPEFVGQFFRSFRAILGEKSLDKLKAAGNAAKGQSAVEDLGNIFILKPTDGPDDLKRGELLLAKYGLKAEKVNLAEEMPELNIYEKLTAEQIACFQEEMRNCHYWLITLDEGEHGQNTDTLKQQPFALAYTVEKEILQVSLTGRLDSISAPQLLMAWEAEKAVKTIAGVSIDCTKLEYISSAGIRLLQEMQKNCSQGIRFTGVNPSVERILQQKGWVGGRYMFRKMRRFKQQLSEEECREVLREQKRGVLSVLGDDGYPYGIPMNHWYSEKDGVIYFHSAKEGHKLDAIKVCDKVSFCVHDEGYRNPGEWALNIKSVVVFGRMKLVTDEAKAREIGTALVRKFTDDEAYLEKELKHALPRVQCLALVPEHMTGKLVNES